jgi:oleate hydratase
MNDRPMTSPTSVHREAHLVGGGIAALASAAYLIRDGRWNGDAIHIYEETPLIGGSLDAGGNADSGYVIRGERMFTYETYTCTMDLLSSVPALADPQSSVADEILRFNETVAFQPHCRLVSGRRKADESSLGLTAADRLSLVMVMATPEKLLGVRRIQDHFPPAFFDSVFWLRFCTSFAFQRWHSVVEFKRYLHRFLHEFPNLHGVVGIRRTPYNENDSIISPLRAWLATHGVNFVAGAKVTDLDFEDRGGRAAVRRLHLQQNGLVRTVDLAVGDLVLVTNGSMTGASSFGSMTSPPMARPDTHRAAWTLWEKLADRRPGFGRPEVFARDVSRTRLVTFTVTLKDNAFQELMEAFTGDRDGEGGLVTFIDSPWLLSILLPHQPHFLAQDAGVSVLWGYGLTMDRPGSVVEKPMADCTGKEILVELLHHLPFSERREAILDCAISIPCEMPFATSQLMPRLKGDRPPIRPPGVEDFAFVGQFCEMPADVVFTIEYSIRSAQTAVYTLLGLKKRIPPIYHGRHDPRVVLASVATLMR